MRVITGHQPVYLPWLGLFHKISLADVFIFMDDVRYLEQDWNNRNKIKGQHGSFWLTVPVKLKNSGSLLLKDIVVDSGGWGGKRHWQIRHWKSIQSCYAKTPYWEEYAPFFEKLYTKRPWKWLSELNEAVLQYLLRILGVEVEIVKASEYGFQGYKSGMVLDHCRKLDANLCVLGTLGRDYIKEEDFLRQGISIYYQDYKHPSYEQRFGEFLSHLSVVDLLFNCGPASGEILLSGNVSKADLTDADSELGGAGVIEYEN